MTLLFLLPATLFAGALIAAMGFAIVHLLGKNGGEPITPTKRRIASTESDLGVRRTEDDPTEAEA